jgi:uncharacterized membrane protein YfcA
MEAHFLGVPGVDAWLFGGLALASFVTTFFGIVSGAAGGLLLLAIMAVVFPPAVLIPVHTVVQLGAGSSRVIMMYRHVMRETVLPFVIGAVIGAALGAQIFVSLSSGLLQAILGVFILVLTWMPRLGRMGALRRRFAVLGFGATFLGIFVSATGTLLAPFVASASPDRHNHASTLAALMAIVHLIKLVTFGLLGIAIGAYLPLLAAMIGTAALGNWVGGLALDRMPEHGFRRLFQVVLTVLGLRLLWAAGQASGLF